MQALYLDLDGTLLGPGGVLVHGVGGVWSLDAVHALEACDRAGAEVVLMSGRARRTLAENARLLGLRSSIAELGGVIDLDGVLHWQTGALERSPAAGTVWEQIEASGAPALLLAHFAGRLEAHTPWHLGRDVTHALRGRVDVAEADALLATHGHGGLRLLDNGPTDHPGSLGALGHVRLYHLLPRGTSKAAGVAAHQALRGYDPAACVAVGDSPEDLTVAATVGAFWLVGNAVREDPALAALAQATPGARLATGRFGAGVLEAVHATLGVR